MLNNTLLNNTLLNNTLLNDQLWWYIARAGGIVALVLAAASVIWGLLLASGMLERTPPRRWLLEVHRWLGGLTVSFTALHMLALWLDSFIEYSVIELVVPLASNQAPGRWPIAWGIVAFYCLAAVQISSIFMKRLPRRWWRAVHMLSFGVLAAGITHGASAGTDSSSSLYLLGVIGLGLITVFLTTYRVLTRRPKPNRRVVAV